MFQPLTPLNATRGNVRPINTFARAGRCAAPAADVQAGFAIKAAAHSRLGLGVTDRSIVKTGIGFRNVRNIGTRHAINIGTLLAPSIVTRLIGEIIGMVV
ncbi:hypothetical protein A2890_00620 [candidate division WWE3 bacterium RIFCSPLOWO2_01_FULL_53_14]|uniref:Uncharacterized protein n=1 Tax=candidate division WWE3 bacterium RIFCSPLOWO2_01_FULL_53_14 TaxID=1802628 RepID=A0A1F4VZN2_UNCKA|nr:MAG: hypothetical protein A2890_00620 [candidate division WWE3 bacterium RIFCSPLOWO2_01_FULL_53_14]